jgi:ATP-dependent RNA helicase DDX3X
MGLATSFYNDRDVDLAENLTKTLLETHQVVPDFLQQYVPDGFTADGKGDIKTLKFEADSDYGDGNGDDNGGAALDDDADAGGWGTSATPAASGWGVAPTEAPAAPAAPAAPVEGDAQWGAAPSVPVQAPSGNRWGATQAFVPAAAGVPVNAATTAPVVPSQQFVGVSSVPFTMPPQGASATQGLAPVAPAAPVAPTAPAGLASSQFAASVSSWGVPSPAPSQPAAPSNGSVWEPPTAGEWGTAGSGW